MNVYTWGSIKGVAVPAATPKETVAYLDATLAQACDDPEFKKIMGDLSQPVMHLNSTEFGKFLKQASDDYAKLSKELNITLE